MRFRSALALSAVVAAAAGALWWLAAGPDGPCGWPAAPYRTFEQPGGPYRVVVYARSGPAMPGQAGDGEACVALIAPDETVLNHATAPIANGVDVVRWGAGVVDVKLVAEWPLPQG